MAELGPLQKEILETVWRLRRTSVQSVLDDVNSRRKDALAYTTVMTVMSQLWEKGLLSRRKIGKAYFYRPTSDRRGYNVERIKEFFSTLFGAGEKVAASHILDALEDEDPAKVKELIEELKERNYI